MLRNIGLVFLLVVPSCSTYAASTIPSQADVDTTIKGCINNNPTTLQRQCLGSYLTRIDAALNRVYNDLLKALQKDQPQRVRFLRAAEQAWMKFRDANADFEASEAGSGTLGPGERLVIVITMTADRARYLDGYPR